jgi:hypothetical protein
MVSFLIIVLPFFLVFGSVKRNFIHTPLTLFRNTLDSDTLGHVFPHAIISRPAAHHGFGLSGQFWALRWDVWSFGSRTVPIGGSE